MNLKELAEQYWGRQVSVQLDDGKVFRGEVFDYISEPDNEPDPESIVIETDGGMLVELFVNEIKEVTVI